MKLIIREHGTVPLNKVPNAKISSSLRDKPSSLSSSVFSSRSRRLKMFSTERQGTGRHRARRVDVSLDLKMRVHVGPGVVDRRESVDFEGY